MNFRGKKAISDQQAAAIRSCHVPHRPGRLKIEEPDTRSLMTLAIIHLEHKDVDLGITLVV